MAAARESALADARRESRNRRVMYPGEEKFYERLDHARAGSAKKKNRPTSAVSSGPGDSRASTPARARVSSAASPAGRTRDRDRDPTSAEGTPSPAPRSAGGSSRASRSLRVSFEAARATGASAARRAARGRDAENADPIGSDPATRRAEEAERALRAAEAQRAAAEAAVAAARAEAERARREALLGPIPDDSESEYGALSPLRSFASPTRASRASRSSRASGSAATRSSPVRSARSSLTRSFMERSGLGSSLSSSIADDLDGAPTAPATPGVFPDDGENRGVAGAAPRHLSRPGRRRPRYRSRCSGRKKKHARYTKDTRDRQRRQRVSVSSSLRARRGTRLARDDAEDLVDDGEGEGVRRARARVGGSAIGAQSRRRRGGGAPPRGCRNRAPGARVARGRERGARRRGTRACAPARRHAVLARHVPPRGDCGVRPVLRLAKRRRSFGKKRFFFERVRERASRKRARTRDAVHARVSRLTPAVPAAALRRGVPGDAPRARRRGARGRARGACALVLVGGECATFKRRDSSRGMESLDPNPDPWNPEARPLRSPYKVAREDDTGVPGPGAAAPARVPVPTRPGWETEAELLGRAAGIGSVRAPDPHRGPVRAGRRARRPRGRGAVRDARGALGDGGFARGQANVRRGDGRDAPRRGGEDGGVFTDIPGALPRGGGVRRRPEGARARAGARRGAAGGARGHRRGRRARGLLRQGGTRGGVRQGARAGGRGRGRGARRPGSLAGRKRAWRKRAWRKRAWLAGAPPRHRLGRRRGGKPPGGARARRRAGGPRGAGGVRRGVPLAARAEGARRGGPP